jgi:lipopolysaccharide export system protein LptC
MTGRLTHALPLVLMLLLGGLTLWLRQAIEGPQSSTPAQKTHDVDAIVDKFTVTRLNEAGQPAARLSAERMLHYGDDDSTELVAPQLLKSDAGSSLKVRADRGTISRDYEEAHFFDNVNLQRTQDGAVDPLEVRTQYLHVLVRREVVNTDRRVTIIRGSSTLSGTGMQYERETGRLSLLSDVTASVNAKRR